MVVMSRLRDTETRHTVGVDLGLGRVLPRKPLTLSSGRYETVLHLGRLAGHPMLTLTSLVDSQPTTPAAPYLWTITSGLRETRAWSPGKVADYLMRAPGVAPGWTRQGILALARARSTP